MSAPLLLALALAAGEPGPKASPLAGEWVAESAVLGGAALPPPAAGLRFGFAPDGAFTVTDGRRKAERGTYRADPPRIDLVPPAGSKDPPLYGVYKVDGDILTVALADKEAHRPARAESARGSRVMLIVFKRAKKD